MWIIDLANAAQKVMDWLGDSAWTICFSCVYPFGSDIVFKTTSQKTPYIKWSSSTDEIQSYDTLDEIMPG